MVGRDIASNLLATEKTLDEYMNEIISHFLNKYNHNVNQVALKLDIGKSTIYRLLKENKINGRSRRYQVI
jgi:DNA-binding NtrC family response regulator